MKNLFIVLHNVHSVTKVVDTAQVVYGLGFPNFVISRAEGSAAQNGVPDANKLAMKMKKNFIVLPDLKDVLELLETEKPIMVTSPVLTKERLDFESLKKKVMSGEKLVIILSGSNSSFSRKEMDLGECFSLEARVDIGPAGTAAILLHALRSLQND